MEMRQLRGDDLFTLLNLVSKLEIAEEFGVLLNQGGATASDGLGVKIGSTLVKCVLANASKAKPELNALLADLTGVKAAEIKALPISEYTALIVQLFRKEEMKEAFLSVAPLLGASTEG